MQASLKAPSGAASDVDAVRPGVRQTAVLEALSAPGAGISTASNWRAGDQLGVMLRDILQPGRAAPIDFACAQRLRFCSIFGGAPAPAPDARSLAHIGAKLVPFGSKSASHLTASDLAQGLAMDERGRDSYRVTKWLHAM